MKIKNALIVLALVVVPQWAFADAIEGMWKRPTGILVKFTACGGGFCAVAASGPHAGQSAGKLSALGDGKYAGSLTDLESGKTYSGKATTAAGGLTVSGCVLGGLFCKSESWVRR